MLLSQCLGLSIPQESPPIFVSNNTCDILFKLKTCGYLKTPKQMISIADKSQVTYDNCYLSDLLAIQNSKKDGIPKISSLNAYTLNYASLLCNILVSFSLFFFRVWVCVGVGGGGGLHRA